MSRSWQNLLAILMLPVMDAVPGIVEMYQDYIDGKKELREISMEFNARYISGEEAPTVRSSCPMR